MSHNPFGFSSFRLGKPSLGKRTQETLKVSVLSDSKLRKKDTPVTPNVASPETDPLDAFMEELEKQEEQTYSLQTTKGNLVLDEEDPVESYLAYRDQVAQPLNQEKVDESSDFDEALKDWEDEETELLKKRRNVDSLTPIQQGSVYYQPFRKDFWSGNLSNCQSAEESKRRRSLKDIRLTGQCPAPILLFEESRLPETLIRVIKDNGYVEPTPIQCQAIPAILYGCDVIGIAQTGSGKTAAYSLPMIRHVWEQPRPKRREGPIGLVIAPTRELAHQIATEIRKLGAKAFGLKVCLAVGGESRYEQIKSLKEGVDILVGTPGRIIDLVKSKGCNLHRVTYLVLDEADRMLDLGFEPQVRSVLGQIRPDRQVCLFSATIRNRVEHLIKDNIANAVRISVGEVGTANQDIEQSVKVFSSEKEKFHWLCEHLPETLEQGNVIIFVGTRASCAELTNQLRSLSIATCSIHGETPQEDREGFLKLFRSGDVKLLVATDLVSRGLDIESVHTVINYEVAKNLDWYVHRIGRTGRAGKKGKAYTLLTPKDKSFARELMRYLSSQNVPFPEELSSFVCGGQRSVTLQHFQKAKESE
eukprot:jgi/Galph1/2879/GphlegSOOS_G1493.1